MLLSFKFHPIGQVGLDRLDAAGERWVFEAAGHGPCCAVFWAGSSMTSVASGGTPPLNWATTSNGVPRSTLGVTGFDLNIGRIGFGESGACAVRPRTGLHGQSDDNGDKTPRVAP